MNSEFDNLIIKKSPEMADAIGMVVSASKRSRKQQHKRPKVEYSNLNERLERKIEMFETPSVSKD